MPRKPKPTTEEPRFTATDVGELLAATLKAMQGTRLPKPEPTQEEVRQGEA